MSDLRGYDTVEIKNGSSGKITAAVIVAVAIGAAIGGSYATGMWNASPPPANQRVAANDAPPMRTMPQQTPAVPTVAPGVNGAADQATPAPQADKEAPDKPMRSARAHRAQSTPSDTPDTTQPDATAPDAATLDTTTQGTTDSTQTSAPPVQPDQPAAPQPQQ